jgi:hypothetical protein
MTNVIEYHLGDVAQATAIGTGIERLQSMYSEDYLIPLLRISDTTASGVIVKYNGEVKISHLTVDHPRLKSGQPALAEMEHGKFAQSDFYIHNLSFGSSISFVLKEALLAGDYPTLRLEYLIVGKDDHSVVYSHTTDVSTYANDQMFSHTPTATFSSDDYKAVVTITNDGRILQSASSERVVSPFRVIRAEPSSVIGEVEAFYHDFGKFWIVNTDFDGSGTVDVFLEMVEVFNPFDLEFSFCEDGTCYGTWAFIDLDKGSMYHSYFYSTVFPYGGSGFLKVDFQMSAGADMLILPLYYTTPDTDILLIMDTAGEDIDTQMYEIAESLGMMFGLHHPAHGSFTADDLSSFQYIIWNHIALYPLLSSAELDAIGAWVENGGMLIAMGEHIARSLSLSADSHSIYADPISHHFLTGTLNVDFVQNVSGVVGNKMLGVSGTYYEDDIYHLWDEKSAFVPSSPHYIRTTMGGNIFKDSTGNVKAGQSEVGDGVVQFFDFDFHSIKEVDDMYTFFIEAFMWFWEDPRIIISDSDETMQSKPATLHTYPNPISSDVHLRFLPSAPTTATPRYSIYNIKGQKVSSGILSPTSEGFSTMIHISDMPVASGIYFIRVSAEHDDVVSKVLILR